MDYINMYVFIIALLWKSLQESKVSDNNLGRCTYPQKKTVNLLEHNSFNSTIKIYNVENLSFRKCGSIQYIIQKQSLYRNYIKNILWTMSMYLRADFCSVITTRSSHLCYWHNFVFLNNCYSLCCPSHVDNPFGAHDAN